MDPIPKEEIGNATSIFNLLRNIGGSMGIAAATTSLERRAQRQINLLGTHVNPYNPGARRMLDQIRSALMARGADPYTATRQAYGAAFGMVLRQAALLSFLETFRALGILFLVALPLILLMKRPTRRPATPNAH
jgi:DHA2 family multidrug resistance protein